MDFDSFGERFMCDHSEKHAMVKPLSEVEYSREMRRVRFQSPSKVAFGEARVHANGAAVPNQNE